MGLFRLSLFALLSATWTSSLAVEQTPSPELPAGFRRIESRHLVLYTDLPPDPDVDILGEVFDQAFPEWCAIFKIDPQQNSGWRMQGCLMKSRERFEAAGLAPADLPRFNNGFARGDRLWFFDQTSDYYRRHLLLHEGTHAFMHRFLGGVGSAWFAEGMAELLATHQFQDGKLTLNYFPRSRDDVSKWGRIEIVQTAFAKRRALTLAKIFNYDSRAHQDNDAYGWCWAAAAFLDRNPRYHEQFWKLIEWAGRPDFDRQAQLLIAANPAQLTEDWQLYVANLDYGYDFARMQVPLEIGQPLTANGKHVTITADRFWQPSGVRVERGDSVRVRAKGEFQLADGVKPWMSEPDGVTIRYYQGRPLGMLLMAVRADALEPQEATGLVKPIAVGSDATLKLDRAGTLYFRVNDSAGELADNSGSLDIEISRATKPQVERTSKSAAKR
ncbi:MAG TPA: hypothetical protein VGJ16_12265 [Pirellulales bacterium]